MTTDPTCDDRVIYGLLNAVISDNATVNCVIPFGHYMGDHIVPLNKHTRLISVEDVIKSYHINNPKKSLKRT